MEPEKSGLTRTVGQGSSLLVSNGTLVLLLLLAAVSLFLGGTLVAGLCFVFFLLALAVRWWGLRAIENVTVRVECARPRLFPGEETVVSYRVTNDKALPLPWLELTQNAPPKDCLQEDEAFERYIVPDVNGGHDALRQTFGWVGSWQELVLETRWKGVCRGLYPVEALAARSGDGFGLVHHDAVLPAGQVPTLAVYPRMVEVDAAPFLRIQWDCASGRQGWMEDNTILKGNRDYQPGDSWKAINWRLAARGQGVQVNLYQTIQPRRVRFIFDGESFAGSDARQEQMERALEILSSLLIQLGQRQMELSLALPVSQRFKAVTLQGDSGDVGEMLYYLAGYECRAIPDPRVEPESYKPVVCLPSVFGHSAPPPAGTAYVITRTGESLPMRLLQRLDPARTWILCDEEWELPVRLGYRTMALRSLRKGEEL